MAHAYTPGLKVAPRTLVKKERRLPLKGNITVKKGDKVTSDTVVARTELPGNVTPMNIVNTLSITPEELDEVMFKKEGDKVEKGEMMAQTKGFFGYFKSAVNAPVSGTIESISEVTGQVIIRQAPIPVEMKAYIDGVIDEIMPEEGVILGSEAAFIKGIFGIGGETEGELKFVADDISAVLDENKIDDSLKGKIIVGGSLVKKEAIDKAVKCGVKGIICGGIDAQDLKEVLGYDIGVAITGHEEIGLTVVVTEGFGQINMAQKTFELLKENEGKKASINGATQIRAGVMRPEIIITLNVPDDLNSVKINESSEAGGMNKGDSLRVIRGNHFGEIVEVTDLPVELTVVDSETKVRVVEVQLGSGEKLLLPRANVETIEK